jgi:hypothetical protein
VEHRWRGVGTPGNTLSEGTVRVGGAMARWWDELSPVVLGGVGVGAVVGGDGEGSLQHRGVKGRRMAAQNGKTPSGGSTHRRVGTDRRGDLRR